MKNRKFTLIVLMILGLAACPRNAGAWGTDKIVNPTTGYKYSSERLSVAYDGTIYLGRLVSEQGNNLFQRWEVLRSTDNGATFTSFDGNYLTGTEKYTAFDMIVAGNNATDMRVFVARAYMDTSTYGNTILFDRITQGGTSSPVTLSGSSYSGNSRGFMSLALATDSRDKNSNASPFSISLVAAKADISDSVIAWTDNVGGTNLTRNSMYGTVNYIRNVTAAIGSASPGSSGWGRLGIVWDEYPAFSAPWGNILIQYLFPDDASDPSIFPSAHNVGSTSAIYRKPSLAMSQNTTNSDIYTYIVYERDNSGTTEVTSRMDSVIINAAPGFVSAPNVGTGAGDHREPHTMYNTATDSFLTVYHNGLNNTLVLRGISETNVMTGTVHTISSSFRDALTTMTNASPRIDAIASGQVRAAWNDEGITYFDAQDAFPASVQQTSLSLQEVRLYPNPATDRVNLSFTAGAADHVNITITDITGKTISISQANVVKGYNELRVALNGLPAGNYTLRVTGTQANTAMLFTITD